MNYKLAKELKEAGFPQGFSEHQYGWVESCQSFELDTGDTSIGVSAPTLSELIEQFDSIFIWKWEDRWCAGYQDPKDNLGQWDDCYIDIAFIKGEVKWGAAPEEAAMQLYITRNKK